MKQFSLQFLNALFTPNHYRRLYVVRLAVLAAALCGMSNASLAQITITLSAPSPVAANDVCQGATNAPVFSFTIAGSGTGSTNVVNAITFNQTGTASFPTDIVLYTLWKDAIGGSGTVVATTVGSTFSGLNEAFFASTTTNYFITANVTTSATPGNTITGGAMTSANITSASGAGTVSGSAASQGTQTIRALPTVASITTGAPPACGGQTIALTAGATTGTGVLTSYNWAGPNAPVVSNATSSFNYTTATLLGSGSYSVTVTYPGVGCKSLPAVSTPVTINDAPNNPSAAYLCTNNPMTNFAATNLNRNGITGAVWSSSNSNVATVDPATGQVYPSSSVPLGSTTNITATKGGCSAMTVGTIAARPSRIISGSGAAMTYQMCAESTIVLSTATTGAFTWSSDNTTIATVTNIAPVNVTTVSSLSISPAFGSTTIHYTNNTTGCDTVVFIDVNPRPATINGPTLRPNQVCLGFDTVLTSISPGAIWTSSNSGIASVVPSPLTGTAGIVTGQSLGVAHITYSFTTTGCYRTYSVTVEAVPLPITGSTVTCEAQTMQVSDQSPGGVWSSQATSVATIGGASPGPITVYGVSAGFNNISYTFTSNGCSAIRLIQVNQQPGPIVGPNTVCAGSYIQLSNAVGGGTWSSLQTTVATIDLTSGLLYGQYTTPLPQVAQIDYNVEACLVRSKNVLVNLAPDPITGVQNMCIGGTTTLSDITPGGVWSLTGTTVSTFTSLAPQPTLTGLSLGFATVTYTLPASGCYDTAIVIVYPNPDPIVGKDTVCQGAVVTLSNATGGGTWSSTLLAVAQVIDTTGVVTGIGAGDAIISYNLPTGCFDTALMHVNPPVVATVTITRDPGGITCQGMIDNFIAVQTNGGTPDYQWYKFVTPVGTNSPVYTPTVQNNGDLIVVKMKPRGSCATDSVVYDSVIAVVYPIADTRIDIASAPSNPVASFLGQVYTFTTETTFGGGTPNYQWYRDGVAIPGANGPIYTTPVYEDGYYHCVVTGFTPCNFSAIGVSDSIHILVPFHPNAVSNVAVNGDLLLFPNPSNGSITLSGTLEGNAANELDIEINDVLGHVVYRGKAAAQNGVVNQQINLDSNMPDGAYLLRVSADAYSHVFRFVITR